MINYSIFSVYFINNYDLPLSLHAFFQATNKLFFIGSLGFILHLTYIGKLTYIKRFLSAGIFTIIARITYGAYLIHLTIEIMIMICYPSKLYFDFWKLSILPVGIFVITYVISFGLSLFLESPLINILNIYKD